MTFVYSHHVGSPPPVTLKAVCNAYWACQETSGNRADSSGAGVTLTDNGTVASAQGFVESLASDYTTANNEYLEGADSTKLNYGDVDFSFAGCAYLKSSTQDMAILTKWSAASGNWAYRLWYDFSEDRLIWEVSSDGTTSTQVKADTFGAPPDTTWMRFAVMHDSVNNTIGININDGGTDSAAHTTGVFSSSSAIINLGSQAGAGGYLAGRLEQVGSYQSVLSAAEITYLNRGGYGRDIY